jgi:hypothetical protein
MSCRLALHAGSGQTYQDALPHSVDPPDGSRLEDASSQQQSAANTVFVAAMSLSSLELSITAAVLRLSNTDDGHDLVMRPDNVTINAFGLGVHGPASIIIELAARSGILRPLAHDNQVVGGPALD